MPELPEVEFMVRRLRTMFTSDIKYVEVLRRNGRYFPLGEEIELRGDRPHSIERYGKYIGFYLEHGCMIGHNAMSGFWDTEKEPWTFDYVEGSRKASDKDVRIRFELEDGNVVRFHDSRLFGSLRYYWQKDPLLLPQIKELGPDALSDQWTVQKFQESLKDYEKPIKQALMDQRIVAGVGNIYAAEALWHCKINPMKWACNLDPWQVIRLWEDVNLVLKAAIACDLKYDRYLRVYRQKICSRCHSPITSVKLQERTSYYCPVCQRI